MSRIPLIVLVAILLGVAFSPQAPAWSDLEEGSRRATLLIFEPETCEACQEVRSGLESLQREVTPQRLTLLRYTPEQPDSGKLLAQYRIAALPEYILLDPNQQMVFRMKERIEPEQLLWEINELLGRNELLQVPEAFEPTMREVIWKTGEKKPMILLFWSWGDAEEQEIADAAMQAGIRLFGETVGIFGFNTQLSPVREWMRALGVPESPAYLLISPNHTVYRKSIGRAQPWQLKADLRAYAERFNSELQTILAGLTSLLPIDEYILPATMPPPAPPASDGISPP